jgi:GT2 family glycosyltransferase
MMPAETPDLVLSPVLPSLDGAAWDGAVWIGELWLNAVEAASRTSESTGLPVRCRLEAAAGYRRARLLVRGAHRQLGFVEIGVSDGDVDFGELKAQLARIRLATASPGAADGTLGGRREHTVAVTVIVCTRDRPALLRVALESILAVDYPNFDVIVVDNAATTDATREYVEGLSEPRVRLVSEPRPGLSRARNLGLAEATGEIVAFADDDVIVDRHWLHALIDGFNKGPSVGCVSGLVPAAEIRTPAQSYFDRRVSWSETIDPRVFDWAHPPVDIPLFPFAVRHYGTGANFAVNRNVIRRLGGFDELLGAGTATGGGEDLDVFFRILRSGAQLVYDPAAIVWHRHRASNDELLKQAGTYGLGLGAWFAKLARDPEMAWLVAKVVALRAPALVGHLRAASVESSPLPELETLLPAGIGDKAWRSIAKGAWAYLSASRGSRTPEPLDLELRRAVAPIDRVSQT